MYVRNPQRAGQSLLRISVLMALLAVALITIFAQQRAAYAAGSGGSGTYTFVSTTYVGVPPVSGSNNVAVQINGTGLTNGVANDGITPSSPTVCFTVTPQTPGDGGATSGSLSFAVPGPTTATLSVAVPSTATPGHTITVTIAVPCFNANSAANDTGSISGSSTATITIAAVGAPTVTAISPHIGPAGTVVSITGTNFTAGSTVQFGGTPATKSFISSTSMTATVPGTLTNGVVYDITVNNGTGTSPTSAADQFTYATGPIVTGVSPTSGDASGGTLITVTGQNLASALSVSVGGSACTPISNNTANSLQCITPAHAPGVVDVSVTTGAGTSLNTVDDNFTYTGGASISSISPTFGPTAGATLVTVSGTNLSGATAVTIGGAPCTPIVNNLGSSLQCSTTANVAGTYTVTVVTPQGTPSLTSSYTYTNGPTVTGTSPSTCNTAGGTQITVFGTGFVAGLGTTTVSFGGVAGTSVNVLGTTSLTVVCPAQLSAGQVHVTATTAAGTSAQTNADLFTYTGIGGAVVVSSVFPNVGPTIGGTSVTITGAGFLNTTSVTFGGASAPFFVNSSTSITATAPAHVAGTVEVIVTTPLGSNTTLGTQNDYTYTDGPTITSVSPNTGPASGSPTTFVTITGTGFVVGGAGMTVTFGGTATTNFTVNDVNTIVVIAPAHSAGLVDIRVTTPGGITPITAADQFTFTGTGVPAVTSVSPSSGPVGTIVTITGSGFTGVICPGGISFGGVVADSTSCNIVSDSTITAKVPVNAPSGTIDIIITGPGGSSANTVFDNFLNTSSAQTMTYTLVFRFTLIGWAGVDNVNAATALKGLELPDNPATNNVFNIVTAIWQFDPASQSWKGYFPGSEGVPGANDFTTLRKGVGYFIAVNTSTSWTIILG